MSDRAFVYAAIIIGTLAISLDFASVDLALPALEAQYGLDLESDQWVINGYVLAFAVLMVAGGRLADGYGRRNIFLIGMAIFAIASLLGGMAWSGSSVIGFRVLQGVGAALLWPAMIGMACAAVGESNRGFALGLIFGTCSLGNSAGPVVGGALTEWLSWRWVLWINVPMAIFSILMTAWKVPKDETKAERPHNDYPGMVVLTSGLVALMIVVYQAEPWGWTNFKTLGLSALAIVLFWLFPVVERRAREPLIPSDIIRNHEVLALCFCAVVICQLFFIVLLYFTQYAMKFLGDDPMWAGARVVQFMLSYGVVSYFGGVLYGFFGARRLILGGLACAAVASALLAIFGPGAGWMAFNGSLVLLGIGVGAVIPTVSTRAIEAAGLERASLVSGIVFMCQLAGAALMLAVSTAVFSAVSARDVQSSLARDGIVLNPDQRQAVEEIIAGARSVHALPLRTVAEVDDLAGIVDRAYQAGLSVVLWLSAALVLVSTALVLRFVRPAEASPPSVAAHAAESPHR
ncbi:MAG TPA: MFS transporter [Terrimicrobiaceae bacterium]|nr:MFS transporter [Terrimicrobiaceae bacterium]